MCVVIEGLASDVCGVLIQWHLTLTCNNLLFHCRLEELCLLSLAESIASGRACFCHFKLVCVRVFA